MIRFCNGRMESALNSDSVWALLDWLASNLMAAFCLVISGFSSESGTFDQISMAYIK